MKKKSRMIPMLLCCVGVLLFVLGIWRGEVGTVLKKAVNVCLECIGIG